MTKDKVCFNILHLSDLHTGSKRQKDYWPNINQEFFDDIRFILDEADQRAELDSLDLVLFTGDLTSCGSQSEFQEADKLLRELWGCIQNWFSEKNRTAAAPKLIAIPGNHDLVRKNENPVLGFLLEHWDEADQRARDQLWNSNSEYHKAVQEAFANFSDWWGKTDLKPDKISEGRGLPGDIAATIEKNNLKLGIIGLNSAFLHFQDEVKGKLALDVRQFNRVCNGDGADWTSKHHLCLLATHHPPDWLSNTGRRELEGQIHHGPQRFAMHLYGHMHEGGLESKSFGGSPERNWLQGYSLFGLEEYSSINRMQKRLHGWIFVQLEVGLDPDHAKLKVWPRILVEKKNNNWGLDRDPEILPKNKASTDDIPVRLDEKSRKLRESWSKSIIKTSSISPEIHHPIIELYHVPRPPEEYLVPQQNLQRLTDLFNEITKNMIAVVGIEGAGKTSLTSYFVEFVAVRNYRVLWLNIRDIKRGTTPSVIDILCKLREEIASYCEASDFQKIDANDSRTLKDKILETCEILNRNKYVLVLDDCEQVIYLEEFDELIREFRRRLRLSKVILVSASKVQDIGVVHLRAWEEEDAMRYLQPKGIDRDDPFRGHRIYELFGGNREFLIKIGKWLWTEDDDEDLLTKVYKILDKRYAHLTENEKEALRFCACFGRPISSIKLKEIMDNKALSDALPSLEHQLLLYRDSHDNLTSELPNSWLLKRNQKRGEHHRQIANYYYQRFNAEKDTEAAITAYAQFVLAGELRWSENLKKLGVHLHQKGKDRDVSTLVAKLHPEEPELPAQVQIQISALGFSEAGLLQIEKELNSHLERISGKSRLAKGYKDQLGDCYKELARCMQFRGLYQSEAEYCAKALEHFEQAGNYSKKAAPHYMLGDCFRLRGEYRESLSHLKEAERILTEWPLEDIQEKKCRARILQCRGFIYSNIANPLSEEEFIKANKLLTELDDPLGQIAVRIYQGNHWVEQEINDPEQLIKAEAFFQEAMEEADQRNSPQLRDWAQNQLATILRFQGKYLNALSHYLTSLQSKIETRDTHGLVDTLMNLVTLAEKGHIVVDNAGELVNNLRQIAQKPEWGPKLHENTRARLLELQEMPNSDELALLLSDCSIEMFRQMDSKYFLAKALLERARLHEARGEQDEAAQKISQVIFNYTRPYGYPYIEAQALALQNCISLASWVQEKNYICLCNRWLQVRLNRDTGQADLLAYKDERRIEGLFGAVGLRREKGGEVRNLRTCDPGSELKSKDEFAHGRPVADAHGRGRQVMVTKQLASDENEDRWPDLVWQFTLYQDQEGLMVQISVENGSGRDVILEWLAPLAMDAGKGGQWLPGDGARDWLCLVNGFQSWSPAYVLGFDEKAIRPGSEKHRLLGANPGKSLNQIPEDAGHWISEWVAATVDALSGQAVIAGFVSSTQQFSELEYRWSSEGKLLEWQARSITDGLLLASNTFLNSENLMIDFLNDAVGGLATWANMVQVNMKLGSRFKNAKIPEIWCSWYYYFTNLREEQVLENLIYFHQHSTQYPLDFFEVDDGYEMAIGDWLEVNKTRFPNSMKHLAEEILKRGFQPGLWLAPFLVQHKSKLFREHPEWLLRDEKGHLVSAGRNWYDDLYALDPTHEEMQKAWLRPLIETVTREWGYKFLKLDFLYAAALGGRYQKAGYTRAQAYREGLETIRQAAGEDVFILASGAPLAPSVGLVDAMRVGPDVHTVWEHAEKSGPAAENAIRNVSTRYFMHRKLWINDPDALIVRTEDNYLTRQEVLSLNTVLAMSGGLLAIGDSVPRLRPERRQILDRLLPSYGQAALPVDLFQRHNTQIPQILDLPVQTAFDDWHVVGIFNWEPTAQDMRLDFAVLQIEMAPEKQYHVYDFWEETYLGHFSQGLTLQQIPANGCKLLCIRRVRNEPFLLSSHMHYTQGAMELNDVHYDRESQELSVCLKDLGKPRSRLLFYFPESIQYCEIKASSPGMLWEKVDKHILAIEVLRDGKAQQTQTWTLSELVRPLPEEREAEKRRPVKITINM